MMQETHGNTETQDCTNLSTACCMSIGFLKKNSMFKVAIKTLRKYLKHVTVYNKNNRMLSVLFL